jgi:hypothetical protein
MDDYSVAAAGFAWAAAYERMANGLLRDQLVDAAHFAIDKSFDTEQSICIVPNAVASNRQVQDMPRSGRGPCTGTVPDLSGGTAQTFSLNHNHQTPAYGYGLLTSISSAVAGLRMAGSDHSFSQNNEEIIAKALLLEANRLTEPTGRGFPFDYQFVNRPKVNDKEACLKVVMPDASHFQITAPIDFEPNPDPTQAPIQAGGDCSDYSGYRPRMYPLADFFRDWIGPVSATLPLGFGGSALFPNSLPDGFFAIGREVYYGSLGWDARGSLLVPLPPLPPNPVYPSDSALHVPSSFALRWNDGLDASRRSPFWPVTYAIYYKAWPYSAAEPASYFFFGSGLPCNPDSSGVCTLFVSNVSRGNYRWYIVANMDVTQSTGVAGSVLSTQSTVAYFTIGYDASVSIAWIQPSVTSWGAPNTLTAAGFATGGIGNVALQWRDVTLNGPWTAVAYQAPTNLSNGSWSNTIPSADTCHVFQATAQYSDVSGSNDYDGVALGYCSFRVIWIQPQSSAGFGPPGSLVVAGSARGGPSGALVTLWFRDDTGQSAWSQLSYQAPTDANGIWYNAIPNVDYTHQYSVYITYDDRNSSSCSYFGNGSATTCPYARLPASRI